MSKLKFTIRFIATYLAIALIGGLVVTTLGISPGQTINVCAVLISCLYNCKAYARANGSYFNRADKIQIAATAGLLQGIIVACTGSQAATAAVPAGFILGVAVFLGVLQVILVYFMLSVSKKVLVKQGLLPA